MARKLILKLDNSPRWMPPRRAQVYADSDWDEYRVVFYRDDVKQQGADYHSDDKGDAFMTAAAYVWPGCILGRDYLGRACILHGDDGLPRPKGANTQRGDQMTLEGGEPPHKLGSSGRVTLNGASFYPSVIDARWHVL